MMEKVRLDNWCLGKIEMWDDAGDLSGMVEKITAGNHSIRRPVPYDANDLSARSRRLPQVPQVGDISMKGYSLTTLYIMKITSTTNS